MSHISFNNKWICVKFGIQVEGLNAFNLSSDRLLNIQNGHHYDLITTINGIGHNYKSVNNEWIHLKLKLSKVHVNTVVYKNSDFNIYKMAAVMTPLPKTMGMAISRLIREIKTCKQCHKVGIEASNPTLFTELKYLKRFRRSICENGILRHNNGLLCLG